MLSIFLLPLSQNISLFRELSYLSKKATFRDGGNSYDS
jgi:hypothetical protein